MQDHSKKLTAEFLGTFALVFIGAGSVVVEAHTGMSHMGVQDGKVGLLGIALAHGLTLAAMIHALGSISGGHFNPAVSFAMWFRQLLDAGSLAGYVGAQLAGAVTAAGCLAGIFPDEVAHAALGTPTLGFRISGTQGVWVEGSITFLLVTSILFVTREDNEHRRGAGVAIGSTLVALILFAGPLTGGSANPARFLGPAIVSRQWSEAFVYLIGPIVGAGVAALVFGVFSGAPGTKPAVSGPVAGTREDGARETVEKELMPAPSLAVVSPHDAIRRARQLFRAGEGKRAAQTLTPLLGDLEEYSRDVVDSVRTLLIVIEDEYGTLAMLDPHRHLIYPSGAG